MCAHCLPLFAACLAVAKKYTQALSHPCVNMSLSLNALCCYTRREGIRGRARRFI